MKTLIAGVDAPVNPMVFEVSPRILPPAPSDSESRKSIDGKNKNALLKYNPNHDRMGRFATGGGGGGPLGETFAAYPEVDGWSKRMEQSSMNDRLPRPLTEEDLAELPEETRNKFTEKEALLIYERDGMTVTFADALKTPDRGPNWTTPPKSVAPALTALSELSSKNPSKVPVEVTFRTGVDVSGGGWTLQLSKKTQVSVDTRNLQHSGLKIDGSGWERQAPPSVVKANPTALDYVITHEWGHVIDTKTSYGERAASARISRYALSAKSDHVASESFAELFADFYLSGDGATDLAKQAAQELSWKR